MPILYIWVGGLLHAPYGPYSTYNTDDDCQQPEQLSAGAVIVFTIYNEKRAECYREDEA